ncbi:MAG: PEP-CTERM sorting domain-containing protein [Phycisphaerae bacterium]|nr:PEP-CTERM sorting domain-containing protein [Tepidisphaeraceae bacterium]
MKFPRRTRTLTGLAVLASACALPASGAVVYLNDTFDDGERLTQGPPASIQWTAGGHNATAANAQANLTVAGGAMTLDHTQSAGVNSFAAVWGYFTDSGSPVTIAVGETMRLSFDVSFANGSFINNAGAFRWGLTNSGGSRVTADFAGTNATGIASGSAFSGYRGYDAITPTAPNATAGTELLVRERATSNDGLETGGAYTNLAGGSTTEPTLAADTVYAGFLEITRTGASSVTVQSGLAGAVTPVVTDSTSPFTSFDTVHFFTLDGMSHDITLDNVNVTVSVPEPAALGLAGLAAAGLLRRRRK